MRFLNEDTALNAGIGADDLAGAIKRGDIKNEDATPGRIGGLVEWASDDELLLAGEAAHVGHMALEDCFGFFC